MSGTLQRHRAERGATCSDNVRRMKSLNPDLIMALLLDGSTMSDSYEPVQVFGFEKTGRLNRFLARSMPCMVQHLNRAEYRVGFRSNRSNRLVRSVFITLSLIIKQKKQNEQI